MASSVGTRLVLLFLWIGLPVVLAQNDVNRIPDKVKHRQLYKQTLLEDRATELEKRLPNVIKPNDYFIRIQPYYPAPGITIPTDRNMTFDGQLILKFTVTAETNNFTFDAVNLNMANINLMDANMANLTITNTQYDSNLTHLIIFPANPPVVGQDYTLQFDYTGIINPYLTGGLFYTYYDDIDLTRHYMVATHFETGIHARAVYPSYDEPAYKARFHVTLIYPSSHVALGNMPEAVPTQMGDGWSVMMFPTTPLMSSYLVAFAAGPFVSKSVTNEAGTLVRSWAWTGMEANLEMSANAAAQCLYVMGRFTNFTFPLPKSDQLGLPEFPAGAMENWGLVIYKYQYIAYDARNQPTSTKESATSVICHELAHQSTGSANDVDYALYLDGRLDYSHPVSTMNGPYFDGITYDKGGSLLRMLNYTLGWDVFQGGLQLYIQQHKYGNANHEDLFAAWTTVAQAAGMKDWCGRALNVSDFMDPWILQQGFPMISVVNDGAMSRAKFSQRPYNARSALPPSPYNYSWPVPLFTQNYLDGNAQLQWIHPAYDDCGKSDIENEPSHDRNLHWELANAEFRSFVRVEYDDIGWSRVIQELQDSPSSISVEAKIELIADTQAALDIQQSTDQPWSYARFLTLTHLILENNANLVPFQRAQETINIIERVYLQSTDYALFERYIQRLVTKSYNTLGWTAGNDWDSNMAREQFLPYAVQYSIGNALNQAMTFFQQVRQACHLSTNGTDNCNPLHPDIRPSVYCGAARVGGKSVFNELLMYYRGQASTDFYLSEELNAMLYGLSCTQDSDSLRSLIRMAVTEPAMRGLFTRLRKNRIAPAAMLDFITSANGAMVVNGPLLDVFLQTMTYSWYSARHLEMYRQMNATVSANNNNNLTTAQKQTLQKYYTTVLSNVAWNTKYTPEVTRWFYDNLVPSGFVPWRTRIPTALKPTSYEARIQPYFPSMATFQWNRNFTFDGAVTINFTVMSDTSSIVLNSHRHILYPTSILLFSSESSQSWDILQIDGITKDLDNAILTIPLVMNLPAGSMWSLKMQYTGFIYQDPDEGIYMNWNYYEFNDQKAWIFATDFEGGPSTRSMIPCFDEPIYKARWTITVIHPSDMTALGNSPMASQSLAEQPGWTTTTFAPTPLMSSYLVAIAIGHFSAQQTITQAGTLVGIWTWTGMEQYATFGLKVATGTLDYLGNYLNFTFPLPKADILALPQYTQSAGAMENWGLVISSYWGVLLDPEYAMANDYDNVAGVSAHELAHQWFGDTVTMAWWSNIFLNEGLADYWYVPALTATFPEQRVYWGVCNRYKISETAFTYDAVLGYAKPVITDQGSPFSFEVYNKGSTLIEMLNNALGTTIFKRGFQNYVAKNAYGNAMAPDLWAAFTEAAKVENMTDWNGQPINVAQLMDPWTLQATYPYLAVSVSNGRMSYRQRTIIDTSMLPVSPYGYQWPIPVFSRNGHDMEFHWFIGSDGGADPFWTREFQPTVWQVDNAVQASMIRVLYDEASWAPIGNQLILNPLIFDVVTRTMLLDDTIAFVNSGHLPLSRLLDLSLFLTKETEYLPWYKFSGTLNRIVDNLKLWSDKALLWKYIQTITNLAYTQLAWHPQTQFDKIILTAQITDWACKSGVESCLTVADTLFSEFITACANSLAGTGSCNTIQPDFRGVMYCYGLNRAPSQWSTMEKLYTIAHNKSRYFDRDSSNLLQALTCVNDEHTLTNMASHTVAGTLPPSTLTAIARNDQTTMQLWNYFNANPLEVINGVVNFRTFISAMITSWNSNDHLTLLQNFLNSTIAQQNFGDTEMRAWSSAIGQVKTNIQWMETNGDTIMQWLRDHFS